MVGSLYETVVVDSNLLNWVRALPTDHPNAWTDGHVKKSVPATRQRYLAVAWRNRYSGQFMSPFLRLISY